MSESERINPTGTAQDQRSIKIKSFGLWESLSDLLLFFAFLDGLGIHQNAASYLRFGAAKRIRLILEDVRWLTTNVPVDRTKALTDGECQEAGQHLNSVYLHIRGTLDNFAWALLWQLAPAEANQLDKSGNYNQIGLFRNSVLKHLPDDCQLKSVINSLHEWNDGFRLRRDPVAHRLPLRVIPHVITGSDNIQHYKDLQAQLYANLNDLAKRYSEDDIEVENDSIRSISEQCNHIDELAKEYDAKQLDLNHQMRSLGEFVPVFTCALDESDLIPLYPTITDDCGNLIKIALAVRTFIESASRRVEPG